MADIYLYGDIGPEHYGMMSARQVKEWVKQAADEPVRLRINSGGGDLIEAMAMYTLLAEHEPGVEVYVDSLAASAASYVAMVGRKIIMAANSIMMIHESHTIAVGNKNDLRKTADVLEKFDRGIAVVYSERSKKPLEEVEEAIKAETWLSAQETVEWGLADEVGEKLDMAANITPGRYARQPAGLGQVKAFPAKRIAAEARLAFVKARLKKY